MLISCHSRTGSDFPGTFCHGAPSPAAPRPQPLQHPHPGARRGCCRAPRALSAPAPRLGSDPAAADGTRQDAAHGGSAAGNGARPGPAGAPRAARGAAPAEWQPLPRRRRAAAPSPRQSGFIRAGDAARRARNDGRDAPDPPGAGTDHRARHCPVPQAGARSAQRLRFAANGKRPRAPRSRSSCPARRGGAARAPCCPLPARRTHRGRSEQRRRAWAAPAGRAPCAARPAPGALGARARSPAEPPESPQLPEARGCRHTSSTASCWGSSLQDRLRCWCESGEGKRSWGRVWRRNGSCEERLGELGLAWRE